MLCRERLVGTVELFKHTRGRFTDRHDAIVINSPCFQSLDVLLGDFRVALAGTDRNTKRGGHARSVAARQTVLEISGRRGAIRVERRVERRGRGSHF